MVEEGAGIIDVGGESTRPGAKEVAIDEELVERSQSSRELEKVSEVLDYKGIPYFYIVNPVCRV
jgi:dihydropteroate synthase